MNLYEIITTLQAFQGSNAKQALLESHRDSEMLAIYLKAVYDPAVRYYVTKLPAVKTDGGRAFDLGDIAFMQRFARRELSGKAGQQALRAHLAELNAPGRVLLDLLVKRSIGAGVGETMVLKSFPGLFFIPPYMRCSSLDAKAKERITKHRRFYVQPKRDGSFAYVHRDINREAEVVTRSGNKYPQWFADKMAEGLPAGNVIVGELEVYKDGNVLSRKEGNGILNSIASGEDEAEFSGYVFKQVAWDRLMTEEYTAGISDLPYIERLLRLEAVASQSTYIEVIETVECETWEEATAFYTKETTAGREGAVVKTMDHIWKDGTSKDVVKLKIKFSADYEIEGYYEGEGKDAGSLGGLTVVTHCRKLRTNVGTGFTAEDRKALWAMREMLPHRIVELEANDVISRRGSDTVALSLPVYVELRNDKRKADTLERVLEQLEAARNGQ